MTDCIICYEPVEDEIECSICHSKMHVECWKMITNKDTCPYCRNPINVGIIYTKVHNIDDIKSTEFEDIEVVDMEIDSKMFADSKFKHIKFVNCITTANACELFYGCDRLKSLDVSGLDTSNATNMSGMFAFCYNLETLDLSHFNTSNVTDMSNMFNECKQLQSLNLSNWNTSNVKCMSSMFSECERLQMLDLSNFNTSNVTSLDGMFNRCMELQSLDLSNFNTSNVTDMNCMFNGCDNLKNTNNTYLNDKYKFNM
jgi:surface protein